MTIGIFLKKNFVCSATDLADPQMNLTAAIYGLSTSVEYSTEEDSKWSQNIQRDISLSEYLDAHLKAQPNEIHKNTYRSASKYPGGKYVDLISGSINLANIEAD